MALPPGFLDELRGRVTLSDVAGRKVMWDQRKSNPAKGDFWAPCPFHQEKTASFHVDDRKGFYYCFGCHAKGDMITFVRESENVSFMEAVEVLAREAGMEMPAQTHDPRAAEKRDRATRLADVMEQAVRAYGLALRSGQGSAVRSYIENRGLSADTVKRFEMGFAPDARQGLTASFQEKGLLEEAVAAGLVIRADDGSHFDRFRGRLMFPIRDPRGRCIAFGGRAMSDKARAKYLNSPETELFHKSRVLYNHGPAREAAGKTGQLIVAEGYMDVIALAQAGFDHAVAPLGTAITEEQLGMMWRIADEPIIALDGDKAGLRAAERLIDLALPLLAPGKSLRFCLMPEGRDPDDLIKAEGAGAMQSALDAAVPLIEMLWRRETAEPHDTPERWAALKTRLRAATRQIANRDVRDAYGTRLAELLRGLSSPAAGGPAPGPNGGGFGPGRPGARGMRRGMIAGPAPSTRTSSVLQANSPAAAARVREREILAGVLLHPDVLATINAALEEMRITSNDLSGLRDAMLDSGPGPDFETRLEGTWAGARTLLLSGLPEQLHPLARPRRDADQMARILLDAIARHEATLTAEAELADAPRELANAEAEDERWSRAVLRARAEQRAADESATKERERDPNAHPAGRIQEMLDSQVWRKKGRG
ncbi:MAG: DNA primase [Pseudomonadota bacterium]